MGAVDFSFASDLPIAAPDISTAMTDFNIGALAPETGITGMSDPLNAGGLGVRSTGTPGAPGGGTPWADYLKMAGAGLGIGTGLAQIPLAIAGLNVARQGQKTLARGADTAQAAAQPQIAMEQALLPAATKALLGEGLPPNLQQQVDLQVNQAKQALLQQLSSAGIDPATAEAMIAGQLEQLRTQLTNQYALALKTGGEPGSAGFVGAQAGQLGGQEMTAANQALSGSQQALNRLLAAGG